MDLNILKTEWQQAAKGKALAAQELEQMTKISKHPVLGRIRLKLIVEAAAMSVLLITFYDIFDGHLKPAYASVTLVLGVVFYLASNLYSFFTLQQPVKPGSIATSLQHYLLQLQRAKVFSLTSLVLLSVSLWVFFVSGVPLDLKRVLLLIAMGGLTFVFLYISLRTWTRWISRIRQSIDEVVL